ncbi:MAG: hypothetical protein OEV78_12600, partial [Spirochaetia bacterium]|nr:hypothetical protein [Spirochaetia bacterium]
MKKIYLFSVYFLSILTIGNCITFPTYQASLIESHDISNSVVNPVGFSTDGTFFYILDMDLGNYDSTTGIQSYNYIHLNIYNAADFSLSQNIDITLLLYQLTQNNAIIISEYEGPLVYFQDRILMRGNNNSIFYNIEYDLNTGVFRLISDLPSVSGYFGYNSDASVLWFYNPNNNDFKEYTFNSLTNLFTLSSSSKFNGSDTI